MSIHHFVGDDGDATYDAVGADVDDNDADDADDVADADDDDIA